MNPPQVAGPIVAMMLLLAMLGALLAAYFTAVRAAVKLRPVKTFDVGGRFDQHYSRIMPPAVAGIINLTYAAFAWGWLSDWPVNRQFPWLHLPFGNILAGIGGTLVVIWLAAKAAVDLVKALWFASRWLRLEAIRIHWHTTDSGEQHRIMWLRPSGEFLYDTTIRDHRLQQELMAIRARRQALVVKAAGAALALFAWLVVPALFEALAPYLSPEFVRFLNRWSVSSIVAWLILLFAVIPKIVAALAALADELVYRSGAQFIPGAKVLGPRPVPLGRQHVEAQMAHGDADFVSPIEAIRRMAGQREL